MGRPLGYRLNRATGKYEMPANAPAPERIDPPAERDEPEGSDPEFAERAAEAGLARRPDDDALPRRRSKFKTKDISAIEDLLYAIHLQLALHTPVKQWEISQEKAHNLCIAIGNVAAHYNVPELPQKFVDWAKLGIVASNIYVPIGLAYVTIWTAPRTQGTVATPPGPLPAGPAPAPSKPDAMPQDARGNGPPPPIFPAGAAQFPVDNLVDANGFPVSAGGPENFR